MNTSNNGIDKDKKDGVNFTLMLRFYGCFFLPKLTHKAILLCTLVFSGKSPGFLPTAPSPKFFNRPPPMIRIFIQILSIHLLPPFLSLHSLF